MAKVSVGVHATLPKYSMKLRSFLMTLKLTGRLPLSAQSVPKVFPKKSTLPLKHWPPG